MTWAGRRESVPGARGDAGPLEVPGRGRRRLEPGGGHEVRGPGPGQLGPGAGPDGLARAHLQSVLLLLAAAGGARGHRLLHLRKGEPRCRALRAALRFDCTDGVASWASWSDAKKAFCCAELKVGCVAPADQFDCAAARNNWEAAWSEAKKTWCCEHHSGGCPSGEEFHCSGAEGEWSSAKRAWCCKAKVRGPRDGSFHGRAKAAKRPTTAVLGLRTGRRAGAITRSTSAASTMLSPAPIRCATTATPGSPRGRRSGPRTRRRSRLHRGCQATPAYDCDLGFAQWQQSWSQLKQQWCCVQQSRGCQESAPAPAPVQVVHVVHHVHTVEHVDHVLHGDHVDYVHHSHRVEWPLYSCWEDAHWRSWSPHQRQYCCQHEHLYCDDSMDTHQHYHTHVVPYDTHTHYHTHYTTQYHTHHTHVNLPFDCAAGVSNWRSGWSSEKKSYCCETYTLGCEESDVLPMETGEVNDAVEGDATVSSGGDMDELEGDATVSSGSNMDGLEGQGDATVSGGGMGGLEDASTISGEMGGQGDVAVSSGGDMDGLEGDASTVSSGGDMNGLEGDGSVSSGELDGLEGDASTVSSGGDMNGLEGDGSVSSGELDGLEGDATISSGNMEGLEGDVSTFPSGIDGTEVASTDDGAVIN
ncbi:unnamed protein product [Effrenium voratum]|nr:unnamed protein product [Effrenium voratum]